MYEKYELANLIPLLEAIRKPGRYSGMNGVNALTNASFGSAYNKKEVIRELRRAVDAGQDNEINFVPAFANAQQGFSYGLNPYTDWSVSQLQKRPQHFYLFLGLDWYSVSGLGNTNRWFEYLNNPFEGEYDQYWHRIWAWIMDSIKTSASGKNSWKSPILEKDAANFVKKDGGAFIFHNRIPYLRPAGARSTKSKWYEDEWRKDSVRHDVIKDLQLLLKLANNKIITFCTGNESVKALLSAGYCRDKIISWQAHPSQIFHPSTLKKKNLRFKGTEHFSA